MIRPGRRLLTLATRVRPYPTTKRPLTFLPFRTPLAFKSSRGHSSKTNDGDEPDSAPGNPMRRDQHPISGSSTSGAHVKSPASDSESEFEGGSIFGDDDVVPLILGSEKKHFKVTQDNTPSASESIPLPDLDLAEASSLTQETAAPVSESEAKQDSLPSEEEAEAPYTVGFTIPSLPPPVNGARSNPPLFWTHKLYRGPQDQPVKVHYCTKFDEAEKLAKDFLGEQVVGFDMEWEPLATAKSSIKRQISVIQVAAEAKIAVFHIARFDGGSSTEDLIPPSLRTLIESPKIMKTGVGVYSADGTRIKKVLGLEAKGLVELSHFFNMLEDNRTANGTISKKMKAMAHQVETYLKYALPKGSVRTSSWSLPLNSLQIDYAAADAYAGLMLYHVMNEKRKNLRPTPPHPAFAEDGSTVPAFKKASDAKENTSSSVDETARAAAKENASSTLEDTVMANNDTEQSSETAEAPGPDSASFSGPETRTTRQQAVESQTEADKASEYLLGVLSPSEPFLKGWNVVFRGDFTCLSKSQLTQLAKRCGAKVTRNSKDKKFHTDNTLVVMAANDSLRKRVTRQTYWKGLYPYLNEEDFYNLIRFRDHTGFPPMEKPASWQGKSLHTVLYEIVEAACEKNVSVPVLRRPMVASLESACAWTIEAICAANQKPRTVMDLKDIDGGLFLFYFLKDHGYNLMRIISAFYPPESREAQPEQTIAAETP